MVQPEKADTVVSEAACREALSDEERLVTFSQTDSYSTGRVVKHFSLKIVVEEDANVADLVRRLESIDGVASAKIQRDSPQRR